LSAIAGSSLQKQSLSPGKTANPDYVEAHFSATNQSARCSINWWSATTPRSSSAAGWNTASCECSVTNMGYYDDVVIKRDGEWLIQQRTIP